MEQKEKSSNTSCLGYIFKALFILALLFSLAQGCKHCMDTPISKWGTESDWEYW